MYAGTVRGRGHSRDAWSHRGNMPDGQRCPPPPPRTLRCAEAPLCMRVPIESPRILHEEEAKRGDSCGARLPFMRLFGELGRARRKTPTPTRNPSPQAASTPTHLGVESDECDWSSSVRCVTSTGRPSNLGHTKPDTGGVSLVLIPFGKNVYNVRTNTTRSGQTRRAVAPHTRCATATRRAAWSTLHQSRPSSTSLSPAGVPSRARADRCA